MAAADTAPASNAPAGWDAPDFTPDEGAPTPTQATTATVGALTPKRKEAEKKKEGREPESTLPVGQRPIDQPATAAPAPGGWDAPDFAAQPDEAPAAAAAPPSSKLHIANIAAANFIDKFGEAGTKLAGAFPVIADKVHSIFSGKDETGLQDAWFKHTVDPLADAAASNELGPNASKADKITYGISQTAAMIGSVILTGPEAAVDAASTRLAAMGSRAVAGAAGMTAPAATQAIDVGQKVLDATGDKHAAAIAATSSYLTNTAMGMIPAALGASIPVKVATGAGIGVASTEVQRRVQNASMPDNMQEEYDPLQSELGAITGAAFGVHAAIAGHGAPVREEHTTAMDIAQKHAAEVVAEAGGDTLDQTVAATHAAATVGGEHDAAAVHHARMETRRAQVEEDTQNTMAAQEGFQREQEFSAAERQRAELEHQQEAPSADEAFAAREAEQPTAASKDADFTAARNQIGQEATNNALGEVRGGREEAPATLADALPPEQLSALGELRARLAAGKPAEEAPKSVVESMREQAKGTEDDFQELPPETAPKQKAEEAPAAPQKAAKVDEDEALPEGGPAPVTAQSLAERRAAAFDKAMADKIGGKGPAAKEEAAPEPAQKSAIESAKPAEAVEPAQEVSAKEPAIKPAPAVNRLAAIRAAAEKARIERNAAPAREEMQWAARDPDSEANKQTFTSFDDAKAWKETHPEDDIVQVPKESPKALGARARPDESLELKRDNPGGDWLEGKKAESEAEGRRPVGAPKRFGSVTGYFNRNVRVPVEKAARVRGLNDEQNNVRQDTLAGLKEHMAGGELPKMSDGQREYAPFVQVDQNGRAWMNEGNHRTMAAKELGWKHLPMEVRYFNGGENVKGEWHPDALSRDDRDLEKTPRLPGKEAPKSNAAVDPMARDIANAGKPSKDEVMQVAKGVIDSLRPSVKNLVNVHDDDSTLPQHLLDDANIQSNYGPNGELPRGVYDPSTKQIHIIAKGHWTPEDAARTLVHELTHLGNRNVLRDYEGTMQSIFKHLHGRDTTLDSPKYGKTDKVTAREWIKDYAEQHGMDLGTELHQNHVVDEYIAHLADQHFATPGHENPGLLQRFVQYVRSALHSMGLKFEWSDQDILDLARRNNTMLRDIRPDVAEREDAMSPRWASHEPDTDPSLPHGDPENVAAKFGRTMEEQAGAGPSTLKSRKDFLGIKGKLTQADAATMGSRLAFLHLDSLPDIMRNMSTPREFVKMVGQMTGRQGRLMEEGNQLALKWSRWANGALAFRDENGKLTSRKGQADNGKSLHDMMHAATLSGIHPDRPYEPLYEGELTPDRQQIENNHKALHRQLSDIYNNKLDSEGREVYQRAKQFYQDRRADVLRGLEARIAETGASAETKKQTMTDLRKKFEQGSVKGPYFPLARFGDHWARAVDPDTGQHFFSRFEDVLQRKRWLENAKANGLNTEQGTKLSDASLVDRIDPDFVKSIMKATEGNKDLQDEIWQHYLKAMPEMSLRKNLIHRKGVLGYTDNALRAFAYNAFHSAHQIARLEYGNRLDAIAGNAEKEADSISASQPESSNALWAPALAKELRKRLEWIKNPKAGSLSSSLTKLGYNWFIGASPATAIRVATQNAMLAEPLLAAKASSRGLGYFGAARGELWKAGMQWAKAKGNLGDKLRGDERLAFDEARAQGTFMSTAAQTLASGGADRPIGTGKLDAWNRVSSFMFNAMEHKNRQTTMLAAYRLARRGGLDHEAATEEAIDMSNKAHFNYNNYNRPRVLQNDAAKVIGLFKQYPWQVTDRLARTFRDGVMRNPDLSPAERNEQLKAFAGYMGKMMLFAGIKGVPILYHATMAAINLAYGDEDKPFDAQAALREHLEQTMGTTASDAIMDGPMSAITGAALSHGASYSDLWYKQPDRDLNAAETVSDIMGQIGGPIPSIATEAAKGIDIINRTGDVERGAEHFTPPFLNHLLKANRIAGEGVNNLRGEQVASPDELSQGWSTGLVGMGLVRQKNIMLQALGFSPEVVARQYEKNTSENNFKTALTDRQKELTERWDNATLRGDTDEAIKWMEKMIKFHQANPGLPWSAGSIAGGIRSEAKARATADHGVNMAPGMAQQYRDMTGAK